MKVDLLAIFYGGSFEVFVADHLWELSRPSQPTQYFYIMLCFRLARLCSIMWKLWKLEGIYIILTRIRLHAVNGSSWQYMLFLSLLRMVCRDIGASDPEFSCINEVEKYVHKELGNDPTIQVRQRYFEREVFTTLRSICPSDTFVSVNAIVYPFHRR